MKTKTKEKTVSSYLNPKFDVAQVQTEQGFCSSGPSSVDDFNPDDSWEPLF